MTRAFVQQNAIVLAQVPQEFPPFHAPLRERQLLANNFATLELARTLVALNREIQVQRVHEILLRLLDGLALRQHTGDFLNLADIVSLRYVDMR